jgi:hypothetical protein
LDTWRPTRDTLQQRVRVIGEAAKQLAAPLSHWWHAALVPGDGELTTRPFHGADGAFDVTVDLREHQVHVQGGGFVPLDLPTDHFVAAFVAALSAAGADVDLDPAGFASPDVYDREAVSRFAGAIAHLVPILSSATVSLGGETGPVNLWPHHFDLAVSWLSGRLVPGVDPTDEENAAEQVTLGFSTGDEAIDDPYCFATAYPLPGGLVGSILPSPAEWLSEAFTGGVLRYGAALATGEPSGAIGAFYRTFLAEAAMRMG